jgi:hypothetical protein
MGMRVPKLIKALPKKKKTKRKLTFFGLVRDSVNNELARPEMGG